MEKYCHVAARFALWAVLFALPQAHAQQVSGTITSRRDPAAEAILKQALAAMGGNGVWSSAKSATLTLSGVTNAKRTLFFDWSQSELRSRMDLGEGTMKRRIISDPVRSSFTMTKDARGKTVRGKTVWLPDELPGLAFYLALTDSRWEIFPSRPSAKHPESRITLRRAGQPASDLSTEQDWEFDLKTGLPESVISYTPTVSHSGLFLEIRKDFKGFSTTSGVSIPTAIDVRYEMSPPISETVQSITFGNGLNQNIFNLSEDAAQ